MLPATLKLNAIALYIYIYITLKITKTKPSKYICRQAVHGSKAIREKTGKILDHNL
jgi:hypothetical protein